MKNLGTGDKIIYKNAGFGAISYEHGHVDSRSRASLFTCSFPDTGMEWDEKLGTWKYDAGLGMVTTLVPVDDPEALAYFQKYDV